MNQNLMLDMDPLSAYECPTFNTIPNYPHPLPNNYYPQNYPPKDYYQNYQLPQNQPSDYNTVVNHNGDNDNHNNDNHNGDNGENVMEDIKPVIEVKKRKSKAKGRLSSYWNKKIVDKDFAFYGCSVCNISYTDIKELDQHVQIHTNRITSYDVRIQNKKKKKRLKKEKKKREKESKNSIKQEFELDIKPEDGYIGNELTTKYNDNGENDNKVTDNGGNDNEIKESKPVNNDNGNIPNENDDNGVKQNNDNKPVNVDSGSKENNENKPTNNGDGSMENTESVPAKNDNGSKENKPANNDNGNNPNENNDNEKSNVYKCFGCGKQFALSYYLRIHVRSHTDEKPYKCNYCEQSFITASKLGRHKKRIHLATRNQCRICYKFFNRFELLVAHFDKKHADDKLDGEPYDYNAILPFLKELEEQLRLERESKEKKPKIEEPWGQSEAPYKYEVPIEMATEDIKEKDEDKTDLKKETVLLPPNDTTNPENTELNKILIEEIKIDVDVVKQEVDDEPDDDDGPEPEVFKPMSDDDVKNERDSESAGSGSDSDYFPPESCALPPRPEASPAGKVAAVTSRPSCTLCNKTFSSQSYLVVHMRTHTGEKPYKCYVCGRGFITSGKMHRHVLTHEETWTGENCIKTEGLDLKEDPDESSSNKKKKLKLAKAKLLQKCKLDKSINKKREHVCEFCQKRFLHSETLQVHKKSHEGETPVIKCNFCFEAQENAEALTAHEQTHVGPKPYLCTLCGKQYKKRVTLVYHKKNHKPTEPAFICDICSKRFRSQTKLQRHIASHATEKYVLRYECPVCAHMFHTRYHVQMHLKSHQKEGLIQEENRSAVLAMVLQNARKIPKTPENQPITTQIQTDERSRICNICGQIFQHFYYLEEHLKTHGSKIALDDEEKEEEKKYTCQVCSKSFKLHYYLKLHSYTHTKEKPYICQQCGKGFITKGKLKRHLETHQGLKKYQCHICYKFFTRPSYLRIHVRTIHGTQDYNFREYSMNQDMGE